MGGMVEGKVAVVTGAASGIGRAVAFALAREGAEAVVVADVRSEPREGGKATHDAINCDSRYVECDVTRVADLDRAVAAADDFGGVDIMVNNAGIVVVKEFLSGGRPSPTTPLDTRRRQLELFAEHVLPAVR